MVEAVAMDEWNIEKVDNMKYGVMEGWSRLSNVLNGSNGRSADSQNFGDKFQPLSSGPSAQEKSDSGAKVDVNFQWGSLSNGSHTCLPAIDSSFSDVAGATFKSGSGVSERECDWFNDIAEVGLQAAKEVSSCVPNDTVFATLVNSHFWDMLIFNLQNVEEESCFMHRLLILTMDESTQLSCDKKHYKHCIPYVRTMGASDFEQTGSSDYNPITWLKSKMALALIHSNLTVFTFDSDVLLFQVPDVDAIISTNIDADIFYQLEKVDYPALYSNASTGENDPNIEHEGFNSGQVLWRPSEMLKLAIPSAFRLGGQPENIEALDQGNIRRAIADANGWGKTQPLSYLYASNYKGKDSVEEHSANWITYHATWVVGHDSKMNVLRKAQDSWKSLQQKGTGNQIIRPEDTEDDHDEGLSIYYASFGGESNCEFCLQKARWIAEFVNATTLFVPTCYGTYHTGGSDVQLFDFYNATMMGNCCINETDNTFTIRSWDPANLTGELHIDQLPCVEVSDGLCENELRALGDHLKFTSITTNISLSDVRKFGRRVYVAGVFDFQPTFSLVGSEYPRIPLFGFCSPPTFNDKILHEARERISEIAGMEPSDTLCVHWRQDDFVGKSKLFVENVSFAADAITEYAQSQGLSSVLLLSDDPTDAAKLERLTFMRSSLHTANLKTFRLRHEMSMDPMSIAIDKAACTSMKGFAGTLGSTFSESILAMREHKAKQHPLACAKKHGNSVEPGVENNILF